MLKQITTEQPMTYLPHHLPDRASHTKAIDKQTHTHAQKHIHTRTHKHAHKNTHTHTFSTYPAWISGRSCPWGEQTRCFPAVQPGSPGSWWSRPSRHCSHHQMSSGSPSCCAQRCCWSPRCHRSTWSHRCLAAKHIGQRWRWPEETILNV